MKKTYQEAIEEINGLFSECNKLPEIGESEITLSQDGLLKEIYAITNGDFSESKNKELIKLLKDCSDIFDEWDSISWFDDSDWQHSSYETVSDNVKNYLENKRECTEFQSCPLCSKATVKTEWLPISGMEKYTDYWLLDENNKTVRGFINYMGVFKLDRKITSDNFGIPVMFAEIKPPKIQG